MTVWTKILLLVLTLRFIKARDNFVAVNDCTCQGYSVTYKCTVFGSGATIWKGTAFDCSLTNNELTIFHSINYTSQRPQTCNAEAIVGRAIRAENGSYTSQITIQVSDEFNGTTVVCAHDSGSNYIEIGSAIVNITTVPFLPPTDVQLVEANHDHTQISFNWSHVSSHCPSLQYLIIADNCGECPSTTTTNMATCTENYIHLTSDPCSFAIRSAVCNSIFGDISNAVTIPMIGTGTGPIDSKASSDPQHESDTVPIRIIIALGVVMTLMFIMIVFITLLFILMTTILLKSKQALQLELNHLHSKVKERPVIYEEISQLQDSLQPSSPALTIEVGENTAYVSGVSVNTQSNATLTIST